MPRGLELFYRRVGSVNFVGSHPEWSGCHYPDALVVYAPSMVIYELEDFLADRQAYLETYGSFRLPVAPDYYHKEDVSGGMWYGIALPDEGDDPPLLEEWHQTTFLDYLCTALAWAGFPGLERSPEHTWPIEELTAGLAFPP